MLSKLWSRFFGPQISRTTRMIVIGVAFATLTAGGLLIHAAMRSSAHDATTASASDPLAGGSSTDDPSISATEASPDPSGSASPSASASASASAKPSPTKKVSLPPRPPLPIPAGFPSPDNTGWKHTGVTLTRAPGNGIYYAETAGQVLDSMDFQGGLIIRADNVVVKRSRVQCGGDSCPGLKVEQDVKNVLIEDVEITSKSATSVMDRAITGYNTINLTVRRVYAHFMQRGIEYGRSALIEDSYIDDEYNTTPAHMSSIGGDTDANFKLIVRHNWIGLAPNQYTSGSMLFYPRDGVSVQNLDVTIEQNIINGGSYCMTLHSDPSYRGKVTVRSNMFGTKYYDDCGIYNSHFIDGFLTLSTVTFTWDNNVWYAPGKAKNGQVIPAKINQ